MAKSRRRSDLDIALESIDCPNTFEDDPRIDSYFETDENLGFGIQPSIIGAPPGTCKKKAKKSVAFVETISYEKTTPVLTREKALIVDADIHRSTTPEDEPGETPLETPKKSVAIVQPEDPPEVLTTPLMDNPVLKVELRKSRRSCRTVRTQTESAERAEDERVKKHALGRWSFPASDLLINVVEADDIKPVKTTPLKSSKIRKKSRRSSMGLTLPRRKSISNTKRMNFEKRDSLRKMSLMKTTIKRKSKIPVKVRDQQPKNYITPHKLPVENRPKPIRSMSERKPAKTELHPKPLTRSNSGIPLSKPEKSITKPYFKAKQNPEKSILKKTNQRTLAELFRDFERGPAQSRAQSPSSSRPAWR